MRFLLVAVAAVLAFPACGGGSGGPSGPVTIRDVWSPDGSRTISAGECLGFTLATDFALEEGATVEVGSLVAPVIAIDANHLRVASEEETGGDCFFLPLFAEPGSWPLTLTSGGATYVIEDAITVAPIDAVDAGLVAKDRVWMSGELERPWDVDVYLATFSDEYHVYDDADFFATGIAIVPGLELWSARFPDAYLGRGGVGLVFPQSGPQYVVVRDVEGKGAPGATYDLGLVGDELGSRTPSDDCDDAPLLTPRAYHVDYDSLEDDFDPDGSCVDSIYGSPIIGRGKDAVWRVRVPAGAELRVSSYDDHLDAVLWIMDPADGCPREPTCIAAAGRFGGGNTDTLVWRNESSAERELLLVHDAVREPDLEEGEDDVGSFLIDLEIFE